MNTYDISTVRGDTYQGFSTTIYKNGSALDLTNAVIRMMVKKSVGESCYVLEFSTLSSLQNVITITEALSGQFTLEPEIIDITPRDYVYDCQITLADSTVITILKGAFVVLPDVTR